MNAHPLAAGVSLYSAAQIKQVEASFAKQGGQGTYPLMERAGLACYQTIKKHWPKATRLLILAGKGNNGGDGLIVARLAVEAGLQVSVCLFNPASQYIGDAAHAQQSLIDSSVKFLSWNEVKLEDYHVVVDALLGTGMKGAVREPFATVINRVNQSGLAVLAVDIPSGLNADSGQVVNTAIRASVTMTFVGYKKGLYTGAATDYLGQLELDTLAIPAGCFPDRNETVEAHSAETLKDLLPPRALTAHKGDFGHCRIIGGSEGMSGAVILAATAAARTGAGLISAWMQAGQNALLARTPEVMAKRIKLHQINDCVDSLALPVTLVVGPGLGQSKWAHHWLENLFANSVFTRANKIMDADALNWLAENPATNAHWVLTPHPGEAGRLLGISTAAVNAERYQASAQLAQKFGGVCVLKGAGTVISSQDGKQVVCPVGNPGMAAGGMGDVLSGIIGGLLAQGLGLFDAAQLGVCIHGQAGDLAAGTGQRFRGLLASDLFEHLPTLLNPRTNPAF